MNLVFSLLLFSLIGFSARSFDSSTMLEVISPYENFLIDLTSMQQREIEYLNHNKIEKIKGIFTQDLYQLLKTKINQKESLVVLINAENNSSVEMRLDQFIEKNFLAENYSTHPSFLRLLGHEKSSEYHMRFKHEELWSFPVKAIVFKDYAKWFESSEDLVWQELKDIKFKSPIPLPTTQSSLIFNQANILSFPFQELKNKNHLQKLHLTFLGGNEIDIDIREENRYILLNPESAHLYLRNGGVNFYVLVPSGVPKKLKFGSSYFFVKKIRSVQTSLAP